jgi:hypothetical protein
MNDSFVFHKRNLTRKYTSGLIRLLAFSLTHSKMGTNSKFSTKKEEENDIKGKYKGIAKTRSKSKIR